MNSRPWVLQLICCGRDAGKERFATEQEAESFREAYTTGPGVDPHGYSGHGHSGHQRAALKRYEHTLAMNSREEGEEKP